MTLRLTQPAGDDDATPRDGGAADLRARLRGARVYCAGGLASVDHEDLETALTAHGASAAGALDDCTLAVVGDGNWPLAMPGSRGDRLRVLEELDRRAARGLLVVGERELMTALGVADPRDGPAD